MVKRSPIRKLLAGMLAATLALGLMPATALALPDANTKGSITVHKLSAMQESTTVPDGNEIADPSQYGQPLAGATFTVTKITLPTLNNGRTFSTTVQPVVNVSNGAVESVVFTDDQGTPYTVDGAGIGTASTTQTTAATTGIAKFDNLEPGYYALVETSAPDGYEPAVPSLITVPMTLADGSGYNYDVHVYPKNLSNTSLITKKVDDNTTIKTPGTDFTWTINAAFRAIQQTDGTPINPAYTLNDLRSGAQAPYTYGNFTVTDTMPANLSYVGSVVSLVKPDGTLVSLTATTDYTYSNNVWTLTPAGIDKAIDNNATHLRVVVTTKLDSTGGAGAGTVLVNKASYALTPADTQKPGGGGETTDDAYKANIAVNKLFSADAEKYMTDNAITKEGITFVLAKVAGPDMSKLNDVADTVNFVRDANGAAIVATTDTNGKAIFEGVPYTGAVVSYYVVETATKSGLQLKQNVVKVDLAAGQAAAGADYTVTTDITNYTQTETDPDGPVFKLPLTGGMGTIVFAVVGIALMGGALFMFMRSRKKNS